MMREQIKEAFSNVQFTVSSHQKYLQILYNLFAKSDFEDFCTEFMRCVDATLRQDMSVNKDGVEKILTFVATFCGKVVAQSEREMSSEEDDSEDSQSNPFLTRLVREVLNYHDLVDVSVRYHSCMLIALIFQHIGDDANLSNDLCDDVQDAMLERIIDVKVGVRIQAVGALLRLQDPSSSDCPVIQSFINAMADQNPLVRKEVVKKIAYCSTSITKIIGRLSDVDHKVRLAAYMKCSTVSPKILKIVDRQSIILCGINEEHKSVKNIYENILLQKWLTVYESDLIKLLNALKLDADQDDIKQTAIIHSNVLKVFFKSQPLRDIVETLSLDDDRLLHMDKLSVEIVTYWYNLINFLQSSGDLDNHLENVLPDLTPLCGFIESVIREKTKLQLDDWEYLEFQQILLLLCKVVGQCDIAEEVGRCTLQKMLISLLTGIKLEATVLTEIITILMMIYSNVEVLSNEICMVISEIREPFVAVSPSKAALKKRDLEVADIRVKICRLECEQESAIANKQFLEAATAHKEITELRERMKVLQNQFSVPEKTREVQNDSETVCRCLDILIALLQHLNIHKLPASLRSCKDEFVMSQFGTNNMAITWRVYKCIVLFALFDKDFAVEKLHTICTPIVIYRMMSTYDKATILICVGAIADLIRLYGTDIFKNGEATELSENGTGKNKNGRRLYRSTETDNAEQLDLDNITCEDIIDIILDMLDDEMVDLREAATLAISTLLVRGLVVSSSLVSRLLLKWLNPLTEKNDQKVQQLLGDAILKFERNVRNSDEILEKAILPTLVCIGNAPKTSPLADIDIEVILQFLAMITKTKRNNTNNSHKNLAYMIFQRIMKKPTDQCVIVLVKMLLHLEVPLDDQLAVTELVKQAEILIEELVDKYSVRNIQKYIRKLKGIESLGGSRMDTMEMNTCNSIAPQDLQSTVEVQLVRITESNASNSVSNSNETVNQRSSASATKSIKRRKLRGKLSMNVGPSTENDASDDSLHTIIEQSVLMSALEDDEVSINTPTTQNSTDSNFSRISTRSSGLKKVMLSETSSDSEARNMSSVKKTRKKVKKT